MFQAFEVQLPVIPEHRFDIRDFGAVPGGITDNTKAFQAAFEAASENGGTVVVPDGIWLSGPIQLHSRTELHLEDNAVLVFAKNKEAYPLIVTDYEGIRRIRTRSPLYAENVEDIAVTGGGLIDGGGHLWRPVKQFKTTERQWNALLKTAPWVIESNEGGIWVPTESIYRSRSAGEVFPDGSVSDEEALRKADPYYDFYRPVMVSLRHCRRVLIEGVRLQNSPAWCVHPYFCEDFTMRYVSVYNPYYAQNGDGLDIESCNRAEIHHCDFQTGDDGICVKSGKDREARKLKQPCENLLIHHCKVGQGFGGFVIGSEMSRGVRNVLVKDCTFINSDVGVRFKSAKGRGGTVEDIYLEDIQMVNIRNEAVVLSMDYVHNQMDYHDPVVQSDDPEDIPEFRNIFFTRCICSDPNKKVHIAPLEGYPDSIHDVHFIDCNLQKPD